MLIISCFNSINRHNVSSCTFHFTCVIYAYFQSSFHVTSLIFVVIYIYIYFCHFHVKSSNFIPKLYIPEFKFYWNWLCSYLHIKHSFLSIYMKFSSFSFTCSYFSLYSNWHTFTSSHASICVISLFCTLNFSLLAHTEIYTFLPHSWI